MFQLYHLIILIMGLSYFYIQLFIKIFSKNKKVELNVFSTAVIISTLQYFMCSLIQENEYSLYPAASIITALLFFTIDIIFLKVKPKITITVFNVILLIYNLVQRYLVLFKGAPFTIDDLDVFYTAMSVANNYDYTPTRGIVLGVILFIVMEVFLFKVKFKDIKVLYFILISLISFSLSFGILFGLFFNRENVEKMGPVNLYDPIASLSNYGPLLNIYIHYLYSQFDYPEDYNEEIIKEELNNIKIETPDGTKAVNIICILEESLFDLSLVKDINPSEDFLPFYHSLKENTIKGNTIVSSFGGGTANSEYEFLMNGNMAFLPKGSYPFTKYINEEAVSIASVLKDLDFKTVAYHPYNKYSWNRDVVYPLIGFDEYYDYLDRFDENTESNLIRDLMSDKGNFDEIIEIYENKEKDENLFLYNVTIQNHAGYGGYPEINSITDSTYSKDDLNTYLSLLKETDIAIKDFIKYFDNVDEPTLICIFGDHIPGNLLDIQEDFDVDNLNESINYYTTPFLIHTNYDIEETSYEDGISLSYLSTLVMDYANLPKSKEQTFVQSFMDKYPIINKYVFGDKDNLNLIENISNELNLWRDYSYMNLSPKK